ncbi:hypothetical protein PMIN06_006429 [Paraphaeosphaeria minitans]
MKVEDKKSEFRSPRLRNTFYYRRTIRQCSHFTLLRQSKHPDSTLPRKINCPKFDMSTATLSSDTEMELIISKMSLEPSVVRSYSFAQGWAKLPDELRLAVLIAVFAQSHGIDHAEHDKLLDTLHLPLLLTANAALATEALFAHNVFRILLARKRYPAPAQNTWIRRMEIKMTDEEATSAWPFFEKLCAGALGLERLREINVTLISNRKKGDPRGTRFNYIVDLGLSPSNLTPIISKVKKLSITRKILFKDSVKCSIWFGPVPVGTLQRAQLWDKIRLEGEYTEALPVPMEFIDTEGQLNSYRQLPFEEVAYPQLGFTRKKGTLQGLQQVRTLTRKYTSWQYREQSQGPLKVVGHESGEALNFL